MAPPVSKVDINSAEESQSQSRLLYASSSSTHKNLKRVRSKVQREDPSSAIKIDGSNPKETVKSTVKAKRGRNPEFRSLAVGEKKHKTFAPSPLSRHLLGNSSKAVCLQVVEGSGHSKTDLSFQKVKTFEDFHVMFKGCCINGELPDDIRSAYYRLCFQKKQFLHDGVPESTGYKFVVGMIDTTVRVANNLKNCQLTTTTKEEFKSWDKMLKSCEICGMKVGFLRERIHTLASFMFESEGAVDIKSYLEAKNELERVESEIPKVAAKLEELKQIAKKCEGLIGSLKQKAEKYDYKLKELVGAPW